MRLLLVFLIINAFASQQSLEVFAGSLFSGIVKAFLPPLSPDDQETQSILFNTLEKTFKGELFKSEGTDEYPPHEDDVTFRCIKQGSKFTVVKLDDPDVTTKLDFTKPINFVVHGFLADIKWLNDTAEAWVKNVSCNVCTIDWRPLAGEFKIDLSRITNFINKLINYPEVSMRFTRLTANAVVRFMKFLKKHGMKVNQVAMAGHSLGAHICGFVGSAFNGEIDAIYGLDPAGPGFKKNGVDAKLDKTDAKYVQAIYTDGNTFGTLTTKGNGHGNFYMNGGNSQRGCKIISCDHSRAYEYFQEAITDYFWGLRCSLNSITKGITWDTIGIHSERKEGNFYVPTTKKSPYAAPKEYYPPFSLVDLSAMDPLEIRKEFDRKGL